VPHSATGRASSTRRTHASDIDTPVST
jgi:hypothetical protein